jgi:penicillin amidase
MPIREDLQAGVVTGLPPFFIRSGPGGNEWLALQHPQPNQAVPYEILPAAEMPHIVNPPAGWLVNCNNDPVGNTLDNDPLNQLRPGGGIYYHGNRRVDQAGRRVSSSFAGWHLLVAAAP